MQGYDGVKFEDLHIEIDKDNIGSSDFDRAFELAIGMALVHGADKSKAIPYLLQAIHRDSHRAIAHLYLGEAMQTDVPSPELTEAKKHTSYQAEYQKAAAMGYGAVKAAAKAKLRG